MESQHCDVLIVGGGPAGSSCAWGLAGSGLDVIVLDRADFPRDKVCAGWITPQILDTLEIDPGHYRKERLLQPIRGFRLSRVGDPDVVADRGAVVSYGIRRCEFDHYLLERCGARLRLGEPISDLRREGDLWLVNGEISTRALVGAGGHFCPVARALGAEPGKTEPTVYAREIEFELTADQQARCTAIGEFPELYFLRDLRGYGWVVRKGDWLNVGVGRQDPEAFPAHVEAFLDYLAERGRIPHDMARKLRGHAYLLYDQAPRPLAADGALLIGDAAGLAYGRSGEGIRPAVESGLLAARCLRECNAQLGAGELARYSQALRDRFGERHERIRPGLTDAIPQRWRDPLVGQFFSSAWFASHVVIDRWFLHRHVPPLRSERSTA